jgi:hypothetical protein
MIYIHDMAVTRFLLALGARSPHASADYTTNMFVFEFPRRTRIMRLRRGDIRPAHP